MKLRKINPFVIGYIVVLALLAAMGYGVGDYTARMKEREAAALTSQQHFISDIGYIDLPRMNMTISSSTGKTGKVRIDMTLEVEQKDMARFEDFEPIITDHLAKYVRQLDMEDLKRPSGVPNLRKELLKEINVISHPLPVFDIIFKQFVIL
jgi:flagellar basal body-associated protein FliL